jgi:hypothetical protein
VLLEDMERNAELDIWREFDTRCRPVLNSWTGSLFTGFVDFPREPVYDLNTVPQPKFRVKSIHELSAIVYDLSAIVYCI